MVEYCAGTAPKPKKITFMPSTALAAAFKKNSDSMREAQKKLEEAQAAVDNAKGDVAKAAAARKLVISAEALVVAVAAQSASLKDLSGAVVSKYTKSKNEAKEAALQVGFFHPNQLLSDLHCPLLLVFRSTLRILRSRLLLSRRKLRS